MYSPLALAVAQAHQHDLRREAQAVRLATGPGRSLASRLRLAVPRSPIGRATPSTLATV